MGERQDVIDQCEGESIELVRLVYVGNDGILRGKIVSADKIGSTFESGINVPKLAQSFTAHDRVVPEGRFVDQGEARLVPDPSTFNELPYAEGAAVMVCDMRLPNGDTWEADPRSRCRSMVDSLEDQGFLPSVTFESEFSLVKEKEEGLQPADQSLGYSVYNMQETHDFVREVVSALEAQGMDFESYVPEYGESQQEFVIRHAPGITAADQHLLFKQTIRAVAANQDRLATFLPKPFGKAGNGCHVHLSLWNKDEENLFYDTDAGHNGGLSATGRHFVAGILQHAPALVALSAPSVSSYDRLQPGKWASSYISWGHDNREATVRIPSTQRGKEAATTRIEFKPADNTANPYLTLLGLFAAGMDGIDNQLEPPRSLEVDPHGLSEAEQDKRGIKRLPETLPEALEELEDDDVLLEALGDDLATSYLEVKYDEWEHSTSEGTEITLEKMIRCF